MKLVALLVVVVAVAFGAYTQVTGSAASASAPGRDRGEPVAASAAAAVVEDEAEAADDDPPKKATATAAEEASSSAKDTKAGKKADKKLAQAVEAERQARVLLSQGQAEDARKQLEKALKLAAKVDAIATGSDVVASAHMHLGTIFGERKWFSACVDHLEIAHRDPRVLDGSLLRERPWPFPETHLEYFNRMHTGMYKHCLHSLRRDEEAREVFQAAFSAGKYRHDWQCTANLSPKDWQLRAQPWWPLEEAANGAEELNKDLEKYKKKLKKESDDFFNKGIAPPGVRGIELNEELAVNGSKTWLELILWKNGEEVEKACTAVPKMCKVLRKSRKAFHPAGQVKLSCMRGGTTATRHCGPCDTKLRMHHAVLLPEFRKADIIVGAETKHWVEGRSLLFDDSFEHTVEFDASEEARRVVLIADLLHPDVPQQARPTLQCR